MLLKYFLSSLNIFFSSFQINSCSILYLETNETEMNDRRESNISILNRNSSFSTGVRRRASMFDPIDPTELQKTLYQDQNEVI